MNVTLPPASTVVSLASTVGGTSAGDVSTATGPTVTSAPFPSVTITLTHAVPAPVGVQTTVARSADTQPPGSPNHW